MSILDEELKRATELAARGDVEAALEIVRPLCEGPDDPRVLGVMAGLLWREGKLVEARDSFRRATVLSPRSELASLGLFHCLWRLGEQDGARAEVVRLLKLRESQEYRMLLEEMGWRFDGESLVDSSHG